MASSCSVTTVRVFMILGCTYSVLTCAASFKSMINMGNLDELELLNHETNPFQFVLPIIINFIGLLGFCCPTRTSYLQWFTFLTLIHALIFALWHLAVLVPLDLESASVSDGKLLETYAKEYQFGSNSSGQAGQEPNHATQVWDALQSQFTCCGAQGPQDWKKWTGTEELPKSCCISLGQDGRCHGAQASNIGCIPILQAVRSALKFMLPMAFVSALLSALLAVYVARHYEPEASILPFDCRKVASK